MSNTTQANPAREAAKRRRQMQVAGKKAATGTTSATPGRSPGGPAREAARARRRAQATGGKVAVDRAMAEPPTGAPEPSAQATPEKPVRESKPRRERQPVRSERSSRRSRRPRPGTQPVAASQAALKSRAWRKAKSGGKKAVEAQTGQSGSAGSLARMANPNASGRQIARQVIADRCANGKTCQSGESERGRRMRQHAGRRNAGPTKVGESHTSFDQRVSGSLVGHDERMTGGREGECRSVTGTEYLGVEDLRIACNLEPTRHPEKVEVTRTGGGRSVSGTAVGYAEGMTGNAAGECAQITGTEYLPADQSDLYCGTGNRQGATVRNPRPENEKRQGGVTGSETRPASSAWSRGPSGQARPGIMKAPTKVAESETAEGSRVTGTQAGLNRPVTGDEPGYCSRVSGTPYQGAEELRERCGSEPAPGPHKVTGSMTLHGQRVTGARAGHGEHLTGHESGVCQSVTGTPYFGLEQSQACAPEQAEAIGYAAQRRRPEHPAAVSGTEPSSVGLTGAQKGVCQTVSGTAYASGDQYAAFCEATGAASPDDPDYPVAIDGQVVAPMAEPAAPTAPAPAAPTGRITGAFSQGSGKVTGDDDNRSLKRQPRGPAAAPAMGAAAAAPDRVTGEGADSGFSITGDGWGRGEHITGTEGPWANRRNPSVRGPQASPFAGAADYRPREGHPVPDIRISGSSGNTDAGSLVTVSGGARG
ncbi:MAG: CsoS2 family carboxysome shell protein [Pseudomonadota bacterium]